MKIQYDPQRNIVRVEKEKSGAMYFIIDGTIDPEKVLLFEVSEKGRCIAFDTTEANAVKEDFDAAVEKFAREKGFRFSSSQKKEEFLE